MVKAMAGEKPLSLQIEGERSAMPCGDMTIGNNANGLTLLT